MFFSSGSAAWYFCILIAGYALNLNNLIVLVPNEAVIEEKAGSRIRAFKDLAFPQSSQTMKRAAGDNTIKAGGKRPKEESIEVKLNILQLRVTINLLFSS